MRWSPGGANPVISKTAYIDPKAVIIGKVSIGENVFVGPGAVIRADEPGSSIIIKDNCNVQDNVVMHSFANTKITIDEEVSLSHGVIVHGPAEIGKGSFIGFGSIVSVANLEEGVFVKHKALVEGVEIPKGKFVESGQLVTKESEVKKLTSVDQKHKDLAKKIINANLALTKGYRSDARGKTL